MNCEGVSVVIPTVGRDSLDRAVTSARQQVFGAPVQILVCVDAPEGSLELPSSVLAQADRVLWTGGGRRGSFARNLGVAESECRWIAFLDDDDEWHRDKLTLQIAVAEPLRMAGKSAVVASRHRQVDVRSGRESAPLPARVYSSGPVSQYLFSKRRPGGGRASIYTSTLLCDRNLARQHRWDESLRRHQDWDWLIRATASDNAVLVQLPEATTRIYTGSPQSISASANWQDSLQWADRVLRDDPKVYADFLAAQCLRYALSARSGDGVRQVMARLRASGTVPSPGPWLIAAAGVLPRETVERMMTWVK